MGILVSIAMRVADPVHLYTKAGIVAEQRRNRTNGDGMDERQGRTKGTCKGGNMKPERGEGVSVSLHTWSTHRERECV